MEADVQLCLQRRLQRPDRWDTTEYFMKEVVDGYKLYCLELFQELKEVYEAEVVDPLKEWTILFNIFEGLKSLFDPFTTLDWQA